MQEVVGSSPILPTKFMYKIAPISLRVYAYLIDLVIVWTMQICLESAAPNLPRIFFLIPGILYFTILITSKWQATVGQRLLSVYVVSKKNKKISFTLAMDRYLSQMFFPLLGVIASSFLHQHEGLEWLWLLLMAIMACSFYWYLVAFKNPENQTMHDYIFRTIVVLGRRN